MDQTGEARTERWRLVGSSAHLVDHLEHCDMCRDLGVRYCSEVADLIAIVRADRALLRALGSAQGV